MGVSAGFATSSVTGVPGVLLSVFMVSPQFSLAVGRAAGYRSPNAWFPAAAAAPEDSFVAAERSYGGETLHKTKQADNPRYQSLTENV